MGFLSFQFVILFVITLVLYHLAAHRRGLANSVLLIASYVFYGWWDWRFLILLIFTTGSDYFFARIIDSSKINARRNIALITSLSINLITLFTFKYFNFFAENFSIAMESIGISTSQIVLSIGLPIGLSFYTFQAISYVVDVHQGRIKAEYNLPTYLAFASFFPQLAAGPIERGERMLPQYRHYRPVSSVDARQAVIWIFYGYFMKVLVADSIAPLTDLGFGPQTSGIWVILGTLAFGLQIYADFCGYSYIARGLALLFGIDIMSNFNRPYWSTSIQEFWYRWHISLSQWLRDYLYIPLGGNRKGTKRTYLNLLLTMLLGGLWHGASWTFVLWGGWHGIMLIINKLWVQHISLRLYDIFGWLLTFTGVMISWFLFRAQSFEQVNFLVSALLRDLTWLPGHTEGIKMIAILSCPIFIIEWLQSKDLSRIKYIKSFCWIISGVAAALAFAALARVRLDFIYFQF